jgi:hypothetical protein
MIDLVYYSVELRCYRDGRVERKWRKGGKWKIVKNNANMETGYNQLKDNDNDTMVLRHRLMAYCFLGLPTLLFDREIEIDHIDRNPLNNNVGNLRLATRQEQNWNTKAKGYYLDKRDGRFYSEIMVNHKKIFLGGFDTAEKASESYQKAKTIYHHI